MKIFNFMLVPLEITKIFKDFLSKNDLGPIKFFYAGEKPKRIYNEIEKSRLKNLTKIYKKFALNQIDSQQLKEEIKKDLQISDELSADITKQIENEQKRPPINNENDTKNLEENKKSIFSALVE